MDAERKEHLREWLVRSLEPVCDADPEVLSKYVLALITNNAQTETLRDVCISKLEEFLGDETTPFVTRLLTAIETNAFGSESQAPAQVSAHEDEHRHHQAHAPSHSSDDTRTASAPPPQRGTRARPSDDDEDFEDEHYEDERGRASKRRREGEYGRDERAHRSLDNSPSTSNHATAVRRGAMQVRSGQGTGAGRGDWERDDRGRGHAPPPPLPGNRHRNFQPEWTMPPPGMWAPPSYGGQGGYPPMPEFDPNGFRPDANGMMPPPHMMNMMPGPMAPPFFPYGGARGRGRGGYAANNRGPGMNMNMTLGPRSADENQGAPGEKSGSGTPTQGATPTGGAAQGHQGAKTTLRVSNVDPKYINMTKLSLHFSKFGNVVNVQMRPNYRCAYVQYATEEEAKKAFHSPIPVCNNRFIEVKWAKYDARDPQGAPSEEVDVGVDETTATSSGTTLMPAQEDAIAPDMSALSEAPPVDMTPEELRAAALETGRKVLEEKRELLEKQRQLKIQKEALLKKQLAQQKVLLERMSQNAANVSSADKRELLVKITALSEELKTLQSPKESNDASKLSGLKAELSALEAQAASRSQSYPGGRGAPRGGGRWAAGRGMFRGGRMGGGRSSRPHYSQSLDNRTTIVRADHLPEEARDVSVLEQHFGNYGSIERVVMDDQVPDRAFIKFHERYAGQTALARGTMYQQAPLDLTWVESHEAPVGLQTPPESQPNSSEAASVPNEAPSSSQVSSESKEVSASA